MAAKQRCGDRRALPPVLWLVGEAHLALGQLDEAERTFAHARTLAAAVADVRGEAYLSCALGRIEARRGRIEQAQALLRHALAVARQAREAPAEQEARAALAELMTPTPPRPRAPNVDLLRR